MQAAGVDSAVSARCRSGNADTQCTKAGYSFAECCERHAGIEEVAKRGRQQRAGQETPTEPDSASVTKEEVLESESGAGQDTEPLRPSSSGDCPSFSAVTPLNRFTSCPYHGQINIHGMSSMGE